jgi:hypothetical protein
VRQIDRNTGLAGTTLATGDGDHLHRTGSVVSCHCGGLIEFYISELHIDGHGGCGETGRCASSASCAAVVESAWCGSNMHTNPESHARTHHAWLQLIVLIGDD